MNPVDLTPALSPAQRSALQQAARWHAHLGDGSGDHDRAAWQAWLDEPVNRWAWQRVERMRRQLLNLPGRLAGETLELASEDRRNNRRSLLKGFALLAGTGALGWSAWRHGPAQQWLADQRTATGELRAIALADGSTLTLNTASAVDVRFDATQRLIVLRQGEILIETARDERATPRPFLVGTDHGHIRALGTRFSVRLLDDRTRVSVDQHSVEITTRDGQRALCEAGQRLEFGRDTLSVPLAAAAGDSAWSRGMLVADDWRLDHFLRELGRYRNGILRCDPAIADHRISGAFRIDDTDQALAALTRLFPVRVEYRTRFWVSVVPVA